jgi:hypothetical protein
MSSFAVLKINRDTKECLFLMANAAGTKTFKNDISNAWTDSDHRVAGNMMARCVDKHNDEDDFKYLIDDLDESGEW